METEKENEDITLSDEELRNVRGSGASDAKKEEWRTQAEAEGRNLLVEANRDQVKYCHQCKAVDSIYAREKWDIKHGFDEWRDCKCYNCGKMIGNINTIGYQVD